MLFRLGCAHVPYVDDQTEIDVGAGRSRIRTSFFLDHSDVGRMLERATTDEKPWHLGKIQEGWEWFAFTFSDQEQIPLSSEEIGSMLEASDQVTRQAFARMLLNNDHAWACHTVRETRQIIEYCRITPGQSVLDFGCGKGRHSIALARSGMRTTGIDYVAGFVAEASSRAQQEGVSGTEFVAADCRDVNLDQCFDAAICLYDVVGTYAGRDDNIRVLANLSGHVKPGGFALISVMNLTLTKRLARHVFSLQREPNRLLELRPSNTMETSGDIFDPDYFVLDEDDNLVYRREQFTSGRDIPSELIVRDRRFSSAEIKAMCNEAGLDIMWGPIRSSRAMG